MEYTKEYLESLIANKIEENASLEYKAAGALGRDTKEKTDITVNVSALANASGGTIIFGIKEFKEETKRHLPEKLDPIDQLQFSREWLDQMISLIRPKIDGVKITPIHVGPDLNQYVYVVEVPQSGTAHQALDHRYYKRRNFEVTSMVDYEIKDVMNRKKHPVLNVSLRISADVPEPRIKVKVHNNSPVLARHFGVRVKMPFKIRGREIHIEDAIFDTEDGISYHRFFVGSNGMRPLFPHSSTTFTTKFQWCEFVEKNLVSTEVVELTAYADEMERLILTKDPKAALADWV